MGLAIPPEGGQDNQQASPDAKLYQQMVRDIKAYAIFMLDPEGVIISWNRGVEEIFGYSEEEFVGQPAHITFTPEDREQGEPQKELEEARTNGQAIDDRWHLRKDGRRFWANGIMTALRNSDGELQGFSKVLRDNTQHKETTEELKQAHDDVKKSRESFAELFRAAPFAAVLTSPDEDRFIEVNDAYERLTGYSRDAVVGRTSKEVDLWISEETREKLYRALRSDGFHELELQLRTQDGHVRDVLVSGTVVYFQGVKAMLKMFYDITQRKRTEEQLSQAVQEVMQDANWFSRALVERLANIRAGKPDAPEVAELTPRERQVLTCIAKGMSNDEIGRELGISSQTVRNYVTLVYSKINVKTRAEAVVWARERGLV